MRSRAVLLILLLFGFSLSPLVSSDSTISSSTTWSGNVVLSGNVTVDSSSTLVLEPGTVVDAKTYWLQVDGILEGTDSTFMTTETSTSLGSTGAGLWGGISISSSGSAVLSNVSISGADSALEVHGDATIHDSITISNSYIGFDIGSSGVVDAKNVTMTTIDIQAVVNHGTLSIDSGLFTNTATGILSTMSLTAEDVSFLNTGVAIDIVSGSADVTGLGLENVSVGIGSDTGATTDISSIYGQHVALLIDGTDASDLTVSNALLSGERLLWGTMDAVSYTHLTLPTKRIV